LLYRAVSLKKAGYPKLSSVVNGTGLSLLSDIESPNDIRSDWVDAIMRDWMTVLFGSVPNADIAAHLENMLALFVNTFLKRFVNWIT